jgi:hypothetical protein
MLPTVKRMKSPSLCIRWRFGVLRKLFILPVLNATDNQKPLEPVLARRAVAIDWQRFGFGMRVDHNDTEIISAFRAGSRDVSGHNAADISLAKLASDSREDLGQIITMQSLEFRSW